MKLTKEKLKQIIKEELAQEAWEGPDAAFSGPPLSQIENQMIQLSEDLEGLATDVQRDGVPEAAQAFLLVSQLVNAYSNVLLADERAGAYLPALVAAAKAWQTNYGPLGDR